MLVGGPLYVWCAAPPSPSPPSSCTALRAKVHPPYPYPWSTAPLSAASLGAPGCEKSEPCAPRTPPCGWRLCVCHNHPVAAGLPRVQLLFYQLSDCLGCGDMSSSLQDHCLEDDGPLRFPLSAPHPTQHSLQCLHEVSPNLPAWRVIAPWWHDHKVASPRLSRCVVTDSALKMCVRFGVDPVSVDLPETDFLQGWGVPWLVPLLPFPICGFWCLVNPSPLLRSSVFRSWKGYGYVSSRSVLFPLFFCSCLSLPSLRAPVSPLSLLRPRLLSRCSLWHPLLVPSGLGRNVGTLPQTLAGHTGASVFAALASCGLTPRRGLTFAAGVDGWTVRSCWCHGMSRRCRPLLLHPPYPLDLNWLARWTSLFIFAFDYL